MTVWQQARHSSAAGLASQTSCLTHGTAEAELPQQSSPDPVTSGQWMQQCSLPSPGPGEPKVADLQVAVCVQQQVAGLEVAVEHARRVHILEAAQHLQSEPCDWWHSRNAVWHRPAGSGPLLTYQHGLGASWQAAMAPYAPGM